MLLGQPIAVEEAPAGLRQFLETAGLAVSLQACSLGGQGNRRCHLRSGDAAAAIRGFVRGLS